MIEISLEMRLAAELMLRDLQQQRLTVTLLPAPDQRFRNHKVRAVEERNPGWYRSLCAEYQSSGRKKPRKRAPRFGDTVIKRRQVEKALRQITGGHGSTLYAERLLPYVDAYMRSYQELDQHEGVHEREIVFA